VKLVSRPPSLTIGLLLSLSFLCPLGFLLLQLWGCLATCCLYLIASLFCSCESHHVLAHLIVSADGGWTDHRPHPSTLWHVHCVPWKLGCNVHRPHPTTLSLRPLRSLEALVSSGAVHCLLELLGLVDELRDDSTSTQIVSKANSESKHRRSVVDLLSTFELLCVLPKSHIPRAT
jgi:hypothetical protein